ncbi:hypothetical protein P3X46_012526 [Hevea brasiliensis]|uniref:Uncharacterized protein n=1 Tax=Hevea brasiliensis TaxID=3981 RepID=A0ABQ9ME49_HEVBR|nr:hypothetical protein P3X46_012526 [Hevea brasiliensis]
MVSFLTQCRTPPVLDAFSVLLNDNSNQRTIPLCLCRYGVVLLLAPPGQYLRGKPGVERAWSHWTKLRRHKLIVALVADKSELPFRMLRRKYGVEAAYIQMLHSRIFSENDKNINQESPLEDRPLFILFCANDPDLMETAPRVEPYFVSQPSCSCSCKISVIPKLEDTINYARMLKEVGCSLLAVHFVSKNVQICLEENGVDGCFSAESLVENPALFAGFQTAKWLTGDKESSRDGKLDQADVLVELTFEFLYNLVDQLRELGVRIPLYLKDVEVDIQEAEVSANGLAN